MHFSTVLGRVLLLITTGVGLVSGAQTPAQIIAGLNELLADVQSLKTTVTSINPAVTGDFTQYTIVNSGNYKATQNKLDSLVSKLNAFAVQATGSTGITPANSQEITDIYNNQLGLELSVVGNLISQKSCLFSTTPNVGTPIANSIGAWQGAIATYTNVLRSLDADINSGILSMFSVVYLLIGSVQKAYQGALCVLSG